MFQPGDLIWAYLQKEIFASNTKSKLVPRADGPFEVLEKISDHAYKVDLPGDYGVSAAFNVTDLGPCQADDYLGDLRIKFFLQGEDDRIPLSEDIDEGLTRSNASARVQTRTHILQKSQEANSEL